jgi:hypothetical protein
MDLSKHHGRELRFTGVKLFKEGAVDFGDEVSKNIHNRFADQARLSSKHFKYDVEITPESAA